MKAAQEAHRVLVSGGRLAVAVWCSLSENPGHAAVVSAVGELVGPAEAEIVGSAFALGDRTRLQEFLSEAGFRGLQSITETRSARFPSSDDLAIGLLRGGTLARSGVELSDDTMAQIMERVSTTLAEYQTADELVFPMSANMVLAKK